MARIVIGERLLLRGAAARFEIAMFGHLDTSSQIVDQNEQLRLAVAELQRGHRAVGAAAGTAEVIAQHAAGARLDGRVDALRQRHRDRSVGGVDHQPALAAVDVLSRGRLGHRVGRVGCAAGGGGKRRNLQRDAAVGAAHRAAADASACHAHAAVGSGHAQPRRFDVAQVDRAVGGGNIHARGGHGAQVNGAVGCRRAHQAAVVANVDRSVARAHVQLAGEVAHLDAAVAAAQPQARLLRHLHQKASPDRVIEPLLLHADDRRSAVVRLAGAHGKPLSGILRAVLAGGNEAGRCATVTARLDLQAGVAQRYLKDRILFRQWQRDNHVVLLIASHSARRRSAVSAVHAGPRRR